MRACVQGGSQAHYLLGLRILNSLVSEMNAPTAGRSLTQHRKIAVNFRRARMGGGWAAGALPWRGCRRKAPRGGGAPEVQQVLHCFAVCPSIPLTPHRDQSLYKVFQLALTALRHLHGTAAEAKLKEQVGGGAPCCCRCCRCCRCCLLRARWLAPPAPAERSAAKG